MPIEAGTETAGAGSPESIGEAYLAEARGTLQSALGKIIHCLDQLADEDLQWRPHASHNSIQTIVLHLCGNVRQWIVSAVGGRPDTRDRPAEFAAREPIPKADLIDQLQRTVAEADAALAACKPASLLGRKRVQGFETTNLAAIFDSVGHFVGHTHQIVYITRLRLGDRYRFQWAPVTKEQGA
jgi:uncharacterized damage-inducible protein DinB